jgi:hypothetical protein
MPVFLGNSEFSWWDAKDRIRYGVPSDAMDVPFYVKL